MLPDFDSNAAFIWAGYSVGLLLIGGECLAESPRGKD